MCLSTISLHSYSSHDSQAKRYPVRFSLCRQKRGEVASGRSYPGGEPGHYAAIGSRVARIVLRMRSECKAKLTAFYSPLLFNKDVERRRWKSSSTQTLGGMKQTRSRYVPGFFSLLPLRLVQATCSLSTNTRSTSSPTPQRGFPLDRWKALPSLQVATMA